MTIKDILKQLETAKHPVAKPLYKGDNFKVLVIGFKSGMKLKDMRRKYLQSLLFYQVV